MNVSQKIATLIARELSLGGNQGDLAIRIGISASALSQYKTSQREPNNEELSKLADYFKVTTDWLLGREEEQIGILREETSGYKIADLLSECERVRESVAAMDRAVQRLKGQPPNPKDQVTRDVGSVVRTELAELKKRRKK